MDASQFQQILEALVVVAGIVFGLFQDRNAKKATAQTQEVVSYYNPGDDSVTAAPDVIPPRSYKMSDQTKRWLTFDHSPEEQEMLLRQVAEAEAEKLATYTITVPSCWYDIEYGLIKGSGKTVA